jgi:hypothetical protein
VTRMTRADHSHVLMLVEKMQRDGHPEPSIHAAVRRVTAVRAAREHPRRRPDRRPGRRFRRFRTHYREAWPPGAVAAS